MMTDVLRDAQYLAPEFLASAKISVPNVDAETTGHLVLKDDEKKNSADDHFIGSM